MERNSSKIPNSVPSEVWINEYRKEVEKPARVELGEEESENKTKRRHIFEEEHVDKTERFLNKQRIIFDLTQAEAGSLRQMT